LRRIVAEATARIQARDHYFTPIFEALMEPDG